jgi:hypothetical protein
VPHCTASSTTNASARCRASDRLTWRRYGPKRAWSSQTPRPQKRQEARAALAQNQQSTCIYPFSADQPIGGSDGVELELGGVEGGDDDGVGRVVGGVVFGGVVRGGVVRGGVGRVVVGFGGLG